MRRLSASRACCLGALGGLIIGSAGCSRSGAQNTPQSAAEPPEVLATIQQQVESVFNKHKSAVVRVEATDVHGQLAGTGFFIDPNGILYTSWGVGGESRDIVVCNGEAKYPARRLVSDMRAGVAILKVDADTPIPFIRVGASRELSVASPVMTIGFPMDLPPTPSFGIVGGFDIKYLGRYFGTRHIRANVAVQRGQGGAPLLNMRGEAVGILISSLDQGSASFVLPIEAAEKVRRDYVRFGHVRPGWLGMVLAEGPKGEVGSTAVVEEVMPDGPAHKAGMAIGDTVLQVGTRPVASPEDMVDASFYLTADDDVTVKIARAGKQLDLVLHPGEAPNALVNTIEAPTAERLKLDREEPIESDLDTETPEIPDTLP
jgi:serine protease Do